MLARKRSAIMIHLDAEKAFTHKTRHRYRRQLQPSWMCNS